MRFVLFVIASALLLVGCATHQLVPLSQVPVGYTQSECRYRESGNRNDSLPNIEYRGPAPDIVCSHALAFVEQPSPEERAWQRKLEEQLDDPTMHQYIDDLCERARHMSAAERAQEAQKLRDTYHLTAACLVAE